MANKNYDKRKVNKKKKTTLKIIKDQNYIPKITYENDSQKTYNKVRKNSSGSEGEILIETYLIQLDISYEKEYRIMIEDIEYRFDFAIFSKSNKRVPVGFIEYDGIQHAKPVDVFGGIKQFNKTVKNDELKNYYCKKNNIKLLRISFEHRSSTSVKIRRTFGKYKGIGAESRIFKL